LKYPSIAPIAEKAQQLPHLPWSLTGGILDFQFTEELEVSFV